MLHDLIRFAAVLFLISAAMFVMLLISRMFSDRRQIRRQDAIIELRSEILSALVSRSDEELDRTLDLDCDPPMLALMLDLFSAIGGDDRERLAAACLRARMVEKAAQLARPREEVRVERCELAGRVGGDFALRLLREAVGDHAWRVTLAAGIELARHDAIAPGELVGLLPKEALRSRRMEMLFDGYPAARGQEIAALQEDERLPQFLRDEVVRIGGGLTAPQPLASEGSPVTDMEPAA